MSPETPQPPAEAQPDFFSSQITRARRFCLDLNPSPTERLAVVCGGREYCTPDYEIHRTTFPMYSIEFVAHGGGTVRLRRRTYPLGPGVLFAYGPGIPHDILPDPAQTNIKYFVDFSGREALRLLRRHGLPPGGVVQTRAPNDILAIFDDLIHNGTRKTPFTAGITSLILRHLIMKIAETAAPPGIPDQQAFGTYTRCKHYIEDRWSDIATVRDAAQACEVDVAYLCRLFQRFDHQSPYRFLVSLRMAEAADRLLAPGSTVHDVAVGLGFADQFHFSRVFKGFFGLSPRRYRDSIHRR